MPTFIRLFLSLTGHCEGIRHLFFVFFFAMDAKVELFVLHSTHRKENLLTFRLDAHCQIEALAHIHYSLKLWLAGSIQTDVCCLLFSKLRVQCYAAGMVNTLKVAACVTAAGRAPSVTFPPTSASTSHAATMGPASWEPASATRATKGKTAKKVIALISHDNVS